MKNNKNLFKCLAVIGGLLISAGAWALTEEEKKALCKTPKILGFNLPEYSQDNKVEVPPESEIHFTISGWTDINTLVVKAKNEKLPLTIENKNLFYKISTKLPASLNGKFVRVNVDAKAEFGCRGSDGWLLKVANSGQAAEPVPVPEAAPSAEAPQVAAEPKVDATQAVDQTPKAAEPEKENSAPVQ
ncbi:hypothetical protein [Methylicorpusculum sp.]|uniref:hypothetical protein n=1 Tax=Methylicorpusculum sp. TaxID=2713644 RepID=UPI0027311ABE|nr:hypothetical protein [Methylicorpusculum sp.]MDP2179457.1 hypothetical protein [Methylicorpusculum sp.]MDP3529403.1 hypothetical protein [Methylicorpusculum sp.]MDZ4150130.1 hypothetical protein [Methylicorpusculum sp.]